RTDWLEKGKSETDAQFSVRMNKLFDDGGEIYNLRADFDQSQELYDKFYKDANNPEAIKYVELYRLATLRTMEYIDKNFNESPQTRVAKFVEYHKGLVTALDPMRTNPGERKIALQQLVESAEYLVKNDVFGGNWKEKLSGYKGEL
ncbi:hypothetical protein HZA40_01710, partial [Candidatus Peregrinibacteria bacterium]|nr:hypothetical protein [Candidatus Peregrinibacteria bacterium]